MNLPLFFRVLYRTIELIKNASYLTKIDACMFFMKSVRLVGIFVAVGV